MQVAQPTGSRAQTASNMALETAAPKDAIAARSSSYKKVRFIDTTQPLPSSPLASHYHGGSSSEGQEGGGGGGGKKLENELVRFLKWIADVNPSAQMLLRGELTELERLAREGREKVFVHGCAIIAGFVVYEFGRVEQEEKEERAVEMCARLSASTPPAPYTLTDTALDLPEPQRTLLRLTMDWFKLAWKMDAGAHVALTRPHLLELGHRAREGDVAKFIGVWADYLVKVVAVYPHSPSRIPSRDVEPVSDSSRRSASPIKGMSDLRFADGFRFMSFADVEDEEKELGTDASALYDKLLAADQSIGVIPAEAQASTSTLCPLQRSFLLTFVSPQSMIFRNG